MHKLSLQRFISDSIYDDITFLVNRLLLIILLSGRPLN